MQRKLEEERLKISEIDCQIIQLLGQRKKHALNIGKIKHVLDLPINQPQIWDEMANARCLNALENEVELPLVTQLFELIHQYSKEVQEKLNENK